jgi:hydrogenase-4 component F
MIIPVVYFIISILLIVLLNLFPSKKIYKAGSLIYIAIHTIFASFAWINKGITILSFFTFDALAVLFIVLSALIGFIALIHSFSYMADETVPAQNRFYSGIIGLLFAANGAYLANHAVITWIFIEATTIAVTILIYHHRHSNALEAAWKYVFISSTGIALAYIGILFVGGNISSESGSSVLFYKNMTQAILTADPLWLKLSFLFILLGYSAKLETFPLYTISIDANYAAPASASALMATVLINAGFTAVYRIYTAFSGNDIIKWMNHVLIITGIISVFIATANMLKVKNLKRLLGYSTLEIMGLVLIGLGQGKIWHYAPFLLLVMNSLVKSTLFLQTGFLHKITGTYSIFKNKNYAEINKWGALILLTGFIFIVAIPPSGYFIAELNLFKGLLIQKNYIIFILLMIMLSLLLFGLFSRVFPILLSPKENVEPASQNKWLFLLQLSLLIISMTYCFYQIPLIEKLIADLIK